MLEPLRGSLRALLGAPCFIRRSRSPRFLFVSDLPRRTEDLDAALRRLAADGRWTASLTDGLLALDPSDGLWREIALRAPRVTPEPPDRYPDHPFLAACAARLCAEDAAPERQPVDPLRHTLKRLDEGALALLEQELPPLLALLLRRHEPLPAAAGRYILYTLNTERSLNHADHLARPL